MGRTSTPLIVRFFKKVRVPSADPAACWEWIGHKSRKGYGRLTEDRLGRDLYAHRAAWSLAHGPVPAGVIVRHKCDNPSCVRPSHLELGTGADNQRDMAMRHRGPRSKAGLPYGVHRNGRRWTAQISIGGNRRKYLGTFDTIDEAAAVAQQEREKIYDH